MKWTKRYLVTLIRLSPAFVLIWGSVLIYQMGEANYKANATRFELAKELQQNRMRMYQDQIERYDSLISEAKDLSRRYEKLIEDELRNK